MYTWLGSAISDPWPNATHWKLKLFIHCQSHTNKCQIPLQILRTNHLRTRVTDLLPVRVTLSRIQLVSGLAQWLGYRSLAYGFSLISAWSMYKMWPLRWQSVRNQANSAFYTSGVRKWVVIRAITWITGVETIKWQTRAAYGWLVTGKIPWARAGLVYGL